MFKKNVFDGPGRLIKNQDVFQGNFTNGIRDGKGVQKVTQGSKVNFYEGDWKDNKKHGKGVEKWKNEKGEVSTYTGDYQEGKKTG